MEIKTPAWQRTCVTTCKTLWSDLGRVEVIIIMFLTSIGSRVLRITEVAESSVKSPCQHEENEQ